MANFIELVFIFELTSIKLILLDNNFKVYLSKSKFLKPKTKIGEFVFIAFPKAVDL